MGAGLRWWNYVNDEGSSVWVFEKGGEEVDMRLSKAEVQIFWTGLVVSPVIWAFLFCPLPTGATLGSARNNRTSPDWFKSSWLSEVPTRKQHGWCCQCLCTTKGFAEYNWHLQVETFQLSFHTESSSMNKSPNFCTIVTTKKV